jgi:hypothetical protein
MDLAEISEYLNQNNKDRARKLFREINKSKMPPHIIDALASFKRGTTECLIKGTYPINALHLRKISEVLEAPSIMEM